MPDKRFKRYVASFAAIILLAFVVLLGQTANLQLVHGQEYVEQSRNGTRREITLQGERGMILDADGVPMAYNENTYQVLFYRDPAKRNAAGNTIYTESIRTAIRYIEESGGRLAQTFAIRKTDSGTFEFYWGNISEEAQQKRLTNWRKNMFIDKNLQTAEEIYRSLRARYRLDESISDDEALKILAVWQEAQLNSYIAYKSIVISTDVPLTAVTKIETYAYELDGISTGQTTKRVYPMEATAAHILGYVGRMQDEDTIAANAQLGYDSDDLVGINGIESTMEAYLTGNTTVHHGSRVVEVNSGGKVTREISKKAATDGNNVVLTLKSTLQKKLEEALENNIRVIRQKQEEAVAENAANNDEEGYIAKVEARGYELMLAEMGAAVVMDVKTGRVLAMANYPSYDNNLFIKGMTNEEYALLANDTASPLFNKAISSRGIPGSIFKMVTAVAGLSEGVVEADEEIDDEGEYTKYVRDGARGPRCWVYPYYEQHQGETTVKALRDSCNYYFYEVASRLQIETLSKWAAKFGLTTKTGIELPSESTSMMADQETLYNPNKALDKQSTSIPVLTMRSIRDYINRVAQKSMSITYSDEVLEPVIEQMMQYHVQHDSGTEEYVESLLTQQIEIPRSVLQEYSVVREVAALLSGVKWNGNMTVRAGIGQSLQLLTPISVARYVSSLINGGKVFEAQLVDKVVAPDGSIVMEKEPVLVEQLDIEPDIFNTIKEGMREVISPEDGGTASSYFENYKYLNEIGGKTGTGQTTDDPIDLENNAWFVAFAPYDDPEIAVAVYIPHGWSGGMASLTARDILEVYLDQKYEKEEDNIPGANTLVP